ncbi:MAG: hypothetical protein ACLR7D_11605 [Lachnospira eligens]
MVKNNYLIFMIALIIYTVARSTKTQEIYRLILVTCAVIAGFADSGSALFPKLVIEKISGCNLGSGASKFGHGLPWDFTHLMAMFMQTAGTADVLLHFTRITITILRKKLRFLKQRLKVILTHIKTTTKAFTSFLSKKVASQWNNPEFQCFWITNVRSSDIEKSPVISDILSLKGSSTFIAFLNIMQSIILFGSMLYAVNTLIEGTFAGAAVLPLTL